MSEAVLASGPSEAEVCDSSVLKELMRKLLKTFLRILILSG